jgi:transcription elongation factor GreA
VADEVFLGAMVKVKELDTGQNHEFTLVGSTEADPTNNRLSNESPLGKALIGRKRGETIDVLTPRGTRQYKIEAIGHKKKTASKKAS